MAETKNTIVVGIDFGTTHSGISWALNVGNRKIHVVNDWPNPAYTVANSAKVPTVISYDANRKPTNWGFECKDSDPRTFRWFKLLLDKTDEKFHRQEDVQNSLRLLSRLKLTAEKVATDYLRLIWEYGLTDIENNRGVGWKTHYKVKPILTVPAIWSETMKNKMRRIACDAGIPEDLTFISEPEAAALAVLREREDEGSLAVGECFVVCDAGGGTVDLISYKILGLNPLSIAECALGEGDLCGSVYVEIELENYVKGIVAESQWRDGSISDSSKRSLREQFDLKVKRAYAGDNNGIAVTLHGVHDNAECHIKRGNIMMQPEALKSAFDTVISKVLFLIQEQVNQTKESGDGIKAILLVGGFGMNRYLHKRVRDTYASQGIEALKVTDAWAAICQGATMRGLESSFEDASATVKSRIMRYSYGICLPDALQSPPATPSYSRPRVLGKEIHWFLEKGKRIEAGEVIELPISSRVKSSLSLRTRNLTETVYYCAYDSPPERMEIGVKKLCDVKYDINSMRLWVREKGWTHLRPSTNYKDVSFKLLVAFDSTGLMFMVVHKGSPMGYGEKVYKEDEH